MQDIYDIIVIGAGAGGLNIAVFMNTVGCRVLLIDKSDTSIGGDCLNYGCVPSKALIHAARTVAAGKQATQYGVTQEGVVDMEKVMAHVNGARETIREHENAEHFRGMGIDVVLGHATFRSKDAVSVAGKEYTSKKIVIATGSRSRTLDIPGIKEATDAGVIHTNETIFNLKTLPKKLVVIGAGPIGVELGQAFRQLGSEVSMVTNDAQILAREDKAMSEVLLGQLLEDGVALHFKKEVLRIEDGHLIVRDAEGSEETALPFDALLVSIGRVLNVDTLGLGNAGINTDDCGKIILDQYLRTSNPRVFVCGDAAGQHQFTHAAELHAGVILRNFFVPFFKKKLNTDHMSWVTYTTPEIATFGLSEAVLKERNISYRVLEESFVHDDRAITEGATSGRVKLLVHPKKGTLFGGSMVARGAGELVQELILAMSSGLRVSALFNKTYPYPAATRINKRVISGYFKDKLTPFAKTVMRKLY